MKTLIITALILLSSTAAYACEGWPISIGKLVRQYIPENGMTYREFDLNNDGKADYGTITPDKAKLPLFYALGQDEPGAVKNPFRARKVYTDKGGKGKCSDIVLYYDRAQEKKDNRFPDGKDRSGFPNFDQRDSATISEGGI